MDHYLRHGLDTIRTYSLESADALGKLISACNFGLDNSSLIEDHSHAFGTLYYSDIFKYIQLYLAHLPVQEYLN